VEVFCYLGSRITGDRCCKKDIVSRISRLKKVFHQKMSLLTAKNNSLEVRKHFIKTYIWNMLIYGSEAWTIMAAEKKISKVMEMWCCRRTMKIKWTKMMNNEVLRRVEAKRNIMKTMR
jgi:hypothetical protein